MEDPRIRTATHETASATVDGETALSPDEVEEIREALHLVRALRALVKTGALEPHSPVEAPPAGPPTDEQYAKALANVRRRMKGMV